MTVGPGLKSEMRDKLPVQFSAALINVILTK